MKTLLVFSFMLVKMVILKKKTSSEDEENTKSSYTAIGKVNQSNPYGSQYGGFSENKVDLWCDSAIEL